MYACRQIVDRLRFANYKTLHLAGTRLVKNKLGLFCFKDDRRFVKHVFSYQMLDLPADQLKVLDTKIYSEGGLLKDLSFFWIKPELLNVFFSHAEFV